MNNTITATHSLRSAYSSSALREKNKLYFYIKLYIKTKAKLMKGFYQNIVVTLLILMKKSHLVRCDLNICRFCYRANLTNRKELCGSKIIFSSDIPLSCHFRLWARRDMKSEFGPVVTANGCHFVAFWVVFVIKFSSSSISTLPFITFTEFALIFISRKSSFLPKKNNYSSLGSMNFLPFCG